MRSREQWDFPNEWAPLTHLFVVSLLKCKPYLPEAGKIARDVANRFLKTAYNGYFHPQNGMVHFFFYIFSNFLSNKNKTPISYAYSLSLSKWLTFIYFL